MTTKQVGLLCAFLSTSLGAIS